MRDFSELSDEALEEMAAAGARIEECYRVLNKANANVVGEVLRGQGEFYEWDHYPKGDVYDRETHSQYYYHAHPPETRLAIYGSEHGHFHTFVRPKGMPRGVKPAPVADFEKPEGPNDALSHLVGISMNRAGFPIRLFTTNRWVTGETWYAADDVVRILDNFVMDHAYPSWPVNIWITEMMRLFRPQIVDLLARRDAAIAEWEESHPDRNAYEDRDLEITSYAAISVEEQMAAVERARTAAGRRKAG